MNDEHTQKHQPSCDKNPRECGCDTSSLYSVLKPVR